MGTSNSGPGGTVGGLQRANSRLLMVVLLLGTLARTAPASAVSTSNTPAPPAVASQAATTWLSKAVAAIPPAGQFVNAYDPQDLHARVAALYVRLGRPADADAFVTAAVQAKAIPSTSSVRQTEARLLAEAGDTTGSIAALRAMESAPTDNYGLRLFPWEVVVRSLVELGRLDAAKVVLDAAPQPPQFAPQDPRQRLTGEIDERRTGGGQPPAVQAVWLADQGQFDKAAALLDKEADANVQAAARAQVARRAAANGNKPVATRLARPAQAAFDAAAKSSTSAMIAGGAWLDLAEAQALLGSRASAARVIDAVRARRGSGVGDAPDSYARVVGLLATTGDVSGAMAAIDRPLLARPPGGWEAYGAVAYQLVKAGLATRATQWVEKLKGPAASRDAYPLACLGMATGLLDFPNQAKAAANRPAALPVAPTTRPAPVTRPATATRPTPLTTPIPAVTSRPTATPRPVAATRAAPTSRPATAAAGSASRPTPPQAAVRPGPRLRLEPVAVVGGPAPGVPGMAFGDIPGPLIVPTAALLADSGVVAVRAPLVGRDRAAAGVGLWVGPPGNLRLVARTGTPAPGTDRAQFERIDGIAGLDDAGRALFTGWVTGPGVDPATAAGAWYGGAGSLALVGRAGYPLVGTADAVRSITPISLTPNGTLVVGASFAGGTVYYRGTPGAWQPLIPPGKAPAGTIGDQPDGIAMTPAVADRGVIAALLVANAPAGPPAADADPLAPSPARHALYVGWPGRLTRAVGAGDPAPGLGAEWRVRQLAGASGLASPRQSDTGTTVVTGAAVTRSPDGSTQEVPAVWWCGSVGGAFLVAAGGRPAPGFDPADRFFTIDETSATAADDGTVYFAGRVGGPARSRAGVWAFRANHLWLVAGAGVPMAVRNLPAGVTCAPAEDEPRLAFGHSGRATVVGRLAGTGVTPTNNTVVLLTGEDGRWEVVARTGDPVDAGNGVAGPLVSVAWAGGPTAGGRFLLAGTVGSSVSTSVFRATPVSPR